MIKKGAMFGLDARIALAIFASLSLIAGAALYKAAQSAKAVQYQQLFEGIVKAAEAYYLDNGSPLPYCSTTNTCSAGLMENSSGLSSWNGPYLDGGWETSADDIFIYIYVNGFVLSFNIALLKASDWVVDDYWVPCDTNSTDCSEWVRINLNTANKMRVGQDMFEKLDKLIDDGDGWLTGKVRYSDDGAGTERIFYRGMPRIDTTD